MATDIISSGVPEANEEKIFVLNIKAENWLIFLIFVLVLLWRIIGKYK